MREDNILSRCIFSKLKSSAAFFCFFQTYTLLLMKPSSQELLGSFQDDMGKNHPEFPISPLNPQKITALCPLCACFCLKVNYKIKLCRMYSQQY